MSVLLQPQGVRFLTANLRTSNYNDWPERRSPTINLMNSDRVRFTVGAFQECEEDQDADLRKGLGHGQFKSVHIEQNSLFWDNEAWEKVKHWTWLLDDGTDRKKRSLIIAALRSRKSGAMGLFGDSHYSPAVTGGSPAIRISEADQTIGHLFEAVKELESPLITVDSPAFIMGVDLNESAGLEVNGPNGNRTVRSVWRDGGMYPLRVRLGPTAIKNGAYATHNDSKTSGVWIDDAPSTLGYRPYAAEVVDARTPEGTNPSDHRWILVRGQLLYRPAA